MSSKPNYRVRTAILIIVSLIPGLVLSLFQNVDGSIVRQVRSESNPSSRVLGKCRDCNDVFLFWITSPREITQNGSISFALLVSSAFFSVLTMLTGDSLVLGVSLGVLILGAGSLILGWFRAQDNLHAYLTGAYQLKVVLMALDLDESAER